MGKRWRAPEKVREEREREARAVEMRMQGASFREIAQAVGYANEASAARAFWRAMDRTPAENVVQLRRTESQRIDQIIQALWPNAMAGSARHGEVICKLIERKARLLGLDAPIVTQIEVITRDVLEHALAELEGDLRALEAGETPND